MYEINIKMKFWVGTTDNNWFNFLAERKFDEVNFWIPSAKPLLTHAPIGMPFLFKLKNPYNHIAGGGFFVGNSTLPLSLAWEVFGEKNGASSFDEFRRLIGRHIQDQRFDPDIGCTVIANPFFLKSEQWLQNPVGWSPNIVRGKFYDTDAVEGAYIWDHISAFSSLYGSEVIRPDLNDVRIEDDGVRYGEPVLVKPRLGQSAFRVLVTDAYQRRCAITGENTLDVLDAAHIVPYSKSGAHDVTNGLLLRTDFHKLFDKGLVSVTPEYRIKVSPRIRESYFNGKAYYRLDNQPLTILPVHTNLQPDRDRLEWHYKNVYQR
jgi:putative restriction endonuclease